MLKISIILFGGTTDIADEPILDALFALLLGYGDLLSRQAQLRRHLMS